MSTKNALGEHGGKLNGLSKRKPALPVEEVDLDGLDVDRPTSTVQEYVVNSQGHDTKQRWLEP